MNKIYLLVLSLLIVGWFDFSCFASKFSYIVKFSSSWFAFSYHFNSSYERWVNRKSSFNSDTIRNFSYSESFSNSTIFLCDNNTFISLNSFSFSFNNFYIDFNCIPNTKFWDICSNLTVSPIPNTGADSFMFSFSIWSIILDMIFSF